MLDIKSSLEQIESFYEEAIEKAIKGYIEKNELGFGAVLNPLRLCIVGSGMGPSLFMIMEMLGKDESIIRIENAVNTIKK